MAVVKKQDADHVLTKDEAWKMFDDEAWSTLKMSGRDFLASWHAGTFSGDKENKAVAELTLLIPLVEES